MMIATIAPLFLAWPLLAAPLCAQSDEDAAPPRGGVLPAAELELENYTPRTKHYGELFTTLRTLHQRELHVELEGGGPSSPVSNMATFGTSILLYDTPEQVQRMLATLEKLEAIALAREAQDVAARAGPRAELVVAEYAPRFLDLAAARAALRPFERSVRLTDGGRSYEQHNVSFVDERAIVVMRDTSEHVAQMLELLARLDRPQPQVMLTAQLVVAKEAGDDEGLPPDLVLNLTKLVGYEHFEGVATSTVRTSVGAPDQAVVLQLATSTDTYELAIQCSAFDAQSGFLTIRECRLSRLGAQGTRLFSTACVVAPNEFTVLGSSGPTPLFAVVRMVPLALD